jgi:flagellar protein FlbD
MEYKNRDQGFSSVEETKLIALTRLNGKKIYINAELIQTVEETPDTMITLMNDKKMMVQETPDQVAELMVAYRRRIFYAPDHQLHAQ